MGKNTLIRKILRNRSEFLEDSNVKASMNSLELLKIIKGNIGFAFIPNEECIIALRNELTNDKIKSSAKVGMIAPVSVIIPAGPTNQDPSQTSFFQALNIPTKINRGQIEIMNDIELIKKGEKVNKSAAELLIMLNIKPFQFGIVVSYIYEKGEIYPANVLDISNKDIFMAFHKLMENIGALCFSVNYPTFASIPHGILKAYNDIFSLGLACKLYNWENLIKMKNNLLNSSKIFKQNPNSNKECLKIKDNKDIENTEESENNQCNP